MTEQILCHECGHDIGDHGIGDWGTDYCDVCFGCPVGSSDIARAYADNRVKATLAAEPSEAEVEAAAKAIHNGIYSGVPGRWARLYQHEKGVWISHALVALRAAAKVRAEQ